ncbi:hypothetical protein SD71_13715 [Cohnella kolymensis]|uniref:SLH domain-containing protein n=1 Tax=Cohnella kolymensis TaxID=1590652 RepID=A0ABR5A2V2_9BACL|nr:S-layer homology domain-containing protein [Cohnella kolymensis]KIL35374.1 hypothetical protein SD71_13715 [Cohnella kolymensis]
MQKLIDQAINEVSRAVNNLNNYDAATMKTVVNGQTTITVEGTKLLTNIENIAKIKKQLKELLDAAKASDQMPVLNLLVDIEFVPETKVAFNLPKNVVEKAIAAGLDGVKLAFGYAAVTIPFQGSTSEALSFNISMKSGKEANLQSNLKLLSQVFDFTLNIGTAQVTEFEKPLTLEFPLNIVGDTTDKELISVAKIIDGKLQFHGGVLSGTKIVEPRDTLSSYVVVENKVSFSDIDSVKGWAGRQIQVIAAKGIAEGKVEGKFSPNDAVTPRGVREDAHPCVEP